MFFREYFFQALKLFEILNLYLSYISNFLLPSIFKIPFKVAFTFKTYFKVNIYINFFKIINVSILQLILNFEIFLHVEISTKC